MSQRCIRISFRTDADNRDRIDRIAEAMNRNRSWIINEALNRYIDTFVQTAETEPEA